MLEQETRWNIIQGYTYYLTFLEQAVQVAQRQIKEGLLEETPEIKAAAEVINEAQKKYGGQIKIDPKAIIRKTYSWPVLKPIFKSLKKIFSQRIVAK